MYLNKLMAICVCALLFPVSAMAQKWSPWSWDPPSNSPVASAGLSAVAESINTGVFSSSDSSSGGYTDTAVEVNIFGPNYASFDFGGWGQTATAGIGFGGMAMWSVVSIEGSGQADASWNNVGLDVDFHAVNKGMGVGDIVVGSQFSSGEIFGFGFDEPYGFQDVSFGSYGFTTQSMEAYSFDGGPAGVSLSSETSITSSVNP